MKKIITLLCVFICLIGLTACGKKVNTVTYDEPTIKNASMMACNVIIQDYTSEDVASLKAMTSTEWASVVEQLKQYSLTMESDVIITAVDSYMSGKEAIGSVSGIEEKDISIKADATNVIAQVKIHGSSHDAVVEILFDKEFAVTSVTTNVTYSLAEKMEKATLNTVLGMGTTFVILILISLIISLFKYIPMIQKRLTRQSKVETRLEAVDQTIAQIIEKEELVDELELVAVITAAITAYRENQQIEPNDNLQTEGFVVRSIKRANTNKWQKA